MDGELVDWDDARIHVGAQCVDPNKFVEAAVPEQNPSLTTIETAAPNRHRWLD